MPYDPTAPGNKAAPVIRALAKLGVHYVGCARAHHGDTAFYIYSFEGLPGAPYARHEAVGIDGLYRKLSAAEELSKTKSAMPSAWAEVRRQAKAGNKAAKDLWAQRVKMLLAKRRKRKR